MSLETPNSKISILNHFKKKAMEGFKQTRKTLPVYLQTPVLEIQICIDSTNNKTKSERTNLKGVIMHYHLW